MTGLVVQFQVGHEEFSPKYPNRLWSPSSVLFSGYWGHFHEGKANHSPPSNAEVKNESSSTSIPSQTFRACMGTLPSQLNTILHSLPSHQR